MKNLSTLKTTNFPKQESHLNTILTLFIGLRLTILFLYSPHGMINAYTDYHYYFRTAKLSDQGYYPFVNMWYEYPPLSTYIVQFSYQIVSNIFPVMELEGIGYEFFAHILSVILLVFDAGVLILIHRISVKLWGCDQANWSAWVYTSLSLPLFFWSYGHSIVMVFFFLLAIDQFIEERWLASAVSVGLGATSKIVPIILLAPITKFVRQPKHKRIMAYISMVVFVVFLVYLPFLILGGGPWIAASFRGISRVGSWSTVWAVLEGNWGPGNYGPLTTRLDLTMADEYLSDPPLIPDVIRTGFFVVIFGWLWLKQAKDKTLYQFMYFTLLTTMVFHLWSKGWSPQWSTLIIPLLLIAFPGWRGIGTSLLLTLFVFVEWPLAGLLNSRIIMMIVIFSRSLLFIIIGIWSFHSYMNLQLNHSRIAEE